MLLSWRQASGPLYRRVYLALKVKIRAGGLGPATKVPSTRALARDLGVSRNTVLLAYEQLAAEGYLVSRHRGATSVAAGAPPRPVPAPARPAAERPAAISAYARRLTARLDLAPSRPPGPRSALRYDFRYGRPAVDEFPREIWRRLLTAHARQASSDALGYGSPAGHGPLRAALSEYLGRARGVVCDPERIVVVNGTQQGLDLIARVLLDPGDGAVVEEPHYPGATIPFEAVGARLLRVPVDAGGLDPARLPPAVERPRLAYVTPCHQFPSGVIMPLERRLALLQWASRVGAWVVEDDYVSEFRYEGHPLEALLQQGQTPLERHDDAAGKLVAGRHVRQARALHGGRKPGWIEPARVHRHAQETGAHRLEGNGGTGVVRLLHDCAVAGIEQHAGDQVEPLPACRLRRRSAGDARDAARPAEVFAERRARGLWPAGEP